MRIGPRAVATAGVLAAIAIAAVLLLRGSGEDGALSEQAPLRLGLSDEVFRDVDAPTREDWFRRTASVGADDVLITATWREIAPDVDPGDDLSDPGNPAYDFAALDAGVRDAARRGLEVMILVNSAPDWAEGEARPGETEAPAGTWRPDPAAIEDFATAIAGRYSGSYEGLPAVRRWQLWAEPNLSVNLTPQWEQGRRVAGDHYRAMLNAFDEGVKSVDSANLVVTGGTGPYGDHIEGGDRVGPVTFWRDVLCLGEALEPESCADPARFDVLAHHPINVGAPDRHALDPEDASTPDIGRIEEVLRAAESGGTAPGDPHPIWATEIWWDSSPPDPDGVPERKQARWLAEAIRILYEQGVRTIYWFEVRDALPSEADFAASPQSGLYLRDGRPKPAARAFRFPFVVTREEGRTEVWGRAPEAGTVEIEAGAGADRESVTEITTGPDGVFEAELGATVDGPLRATQDGIASLTYAPGGFS